jgi:hypothetical protein
MVASAIAGEDNWRRLKRISVGADLASDGRPCDRAVMPNRLYMMVTWNCRHIAQGWVKRRLLELNAHQGIESPVICTPEELGGEFDVG